MKVAGMHVLRRLVLAVLSVTLIAWGSVLSSSAIASAGGKATTRAVVLRPATGPTVTHNGMTTCTTKKTGFATCVGTYGGDRAFDVAQEEKLYNWPPMTPSETVVYPANQPPTVTVDQTTNLVNQVVHVSWSNFTPSTDAGTGLPSPVIQTSSLYHVAIYECHGTNPQSPVGNGGSQASKDCYDILNTTAQTGNNATQGPPNGTLAYTLANGSGEADFYVEAGKEVNQFLKCDVHQPCSLVVVPNWGGTEPGSGFTQACSDHSNDWGNNALIPFGYDSFIGQPCSWADRIVVPLSFLPTPSNCPTTAPSFQAEGSPMLARAMSQWLPGYCQGSKAVLPTYTSNTNEYVARQQFLGGVGAFTSSVDMALVSRPADKASTQGARKFTYAPIANSGIAIAYYIDTPNYANSPNAGKLITNLKLDARLVAKLLTQSYSLDYGCTVDPGRPQNPPPAVSSFCDPAVTHRAGSKVIANPASIFDDPEFLNLNGGNTPTNRLNFPGDAGFVQYGDFVPTVLNGDSDMTYELTRWLMSDPQARAFLQGKPDPSGMRINSNYLHATYPADLFASLDPGWPGDPLYNAKPGDGVAANGFVESMQASWNPVTLLEKIGTDLVTYQPTANNPFCYNFDPASQGSCAVSGHHQIFNYGVKPIVPEIPGQLDLMSVVDMGQAAAYRFPVAQLVNAAGKPVAPTAASLTAGLKDMKTNADGITQYANYTSKDPNMYPLTMVDYAMVPVCDPSRSTASTISTFLHDVATSGQRTGALPGDLAPGYVSLNSAQRAQTLLAAVSVHCPPSHPGGGHQPSVSSSPSPTHSSSPVPPSASPTPSTPAAQNLAYGVKDPNAAGIMRIVLPVLLILGGLLGLGGPAAYTLGTTERGAVLRRRLAKVLRIGKG